MSECGLAVGTVLGFEVGAYLPYDDDFVSSAKS